MAAVFDIVLYTRETCGACQKSKLLLNNYDVPFKEVLIEQDISRSELLDKFPDATSLPVITTTDTTIFNGYDGLVEFLKEKGILPK